MSEIHSRKLASGLTLVVEPLQSVASVAMSWLLPVGSATDSTEHDGASTMLSEMLWRGAGALDSRAHSEALDRVGVQRSSSVRTHHMGVGATMLSERLDDALPLLVSVITEPVLSDDDVEPVRSLSLQTLDAIEDDPQHLVGLMLRERSFASPLNRHGYGERAALESLTGAQLRAAWTERCRPERSILSVAGRVDVDRLAGQLDDLLGAWSGTVAEPVADGQPEGGYAFLELDTAQVHLAFSCPAPCATHEDRVLESLAIAVLSGSTSGRLFSEVRQKRSLCYSVGASYRAGRDDGSISTYAGTTPERAQETLDVCQAEFARLAEGASADEFRRARIGMKSRIVMGGESTVARAGRLAGETYARGAARTLDAVLAEIDAISLDQLNAYLARRTYGPFTLASIGPAALSTETASVAAGG